MANYVSEAVVKRLPSYYRYLKELEQEGVARISSHALAERMLLTASQIRQDINCFGGLGRQGYGYSVSGLRAHIGHIIGLDTTHKMIILGGGNIGRAVAFSDSFKTNGFETVAIFDTDVGKVGTTIGNLKVLDMSEIREYIKNNQVDIAVLAVPLVVAQDTANMLVNAGVRAFWNFSPIDLSLPEEVSVVNVHLDEGLQVLSYRMKQKEDK